MYKAIYVVCITLYTFGFMYIYVGLHVYIHWVTYMSPNVYTLHTSNASQCIYICHPMYIQYTLGIYIGLHPNIHWVARHIHWVAFFVTQCISKKMLPNVYTSKCTAMYIPNVYKMQHNVYPTLYIQGRAKRGVYTLGCILYTFGCILIYI